MTSIRLAIATALLAAITTQDEVRSQVPRGWHVVSSFQSSSTLVPGLGGLSLVHPRAAAMAVPIRSVSGLPPDLTGANNPGVVMGANCVAIRPSDGALLVGEYQQQQGAVIDLHVISIANLPQPIVINATKYPVGTVVATYGGSISACATLPGQDLLFTTNGLSPQGPLQGHPLGIFRSQTAQIVPLAVVFPAGLNHAPNALCLDASGTTAYVGSDLGGWSAIFRIPLGASNPIATRIATVNTTVRGMSIDADNVLHVVGGGGTNTHYCIDFSTGAVNSCPGQNEWNAIAFEANSGDIIAALILPGAKTLDLVHFTPPRGLPSLVVPVPTAGWGIISGIATNPAMTTYGQGTPNANACEWQVAPNPGGLPTIGNQNFTLTIESTTGVPTASVAFFSGAKNPFIWHVFGVSILLDPATLLPGLSMQINSTQSTLNLPIPNIPSLRQLTLYAQGIHIDTAGQLGGSDGLELTFL